jgi:hypothetical protein
LAGAAFFLAGAAFFLAGAFFFTGAFLAGLAAALATGRLGAVALAAGLGAGLAAGCAAFEMPIAAAARAGTRRNNWYFTLLASCPYNMFRRVAIEAHERLFEPIPVILQVRPASTPSR